MKQYRLVFMRYHHDEVAMYQGGKVKDETLMTYTKWRDWNGRDDINPRGACLIEFRETSK